MLFDERIYDVPEAAEATKLSPWTIWDKLKRGVLMRTKIGNRTFVRESELRKLISEAVSKPVAKPKLIVETRGRVQRRRSP